MSIRSQQGMGASAKRLSSVTTPSGIRPSMIAWTRNPSWLALPAVAVTDQKFVGLHAVYPESNFAAVSAAGDYTVDWGDGTTENFAANVTGYHQYTYTNAALNNTNGPVTFQASAGTVTRTAHGYTNDMTVSFASITTTTGISTGQIYYVVNATANTFQVAATLGGAPLTLTSDGSGTLLAYKQAIVIITPQAGQNLTSLTFDIKHSMALLQSYSTGWLDVALGSPNLTTVLFVNGASVKHEMLEQFAIVKTGTLTNFGSGLQNCTTVASIPSLNLTGTFTSTQNWFNGCGNLRSAPYFDTSTVTNMSSMFGSCASLLTIPQYDTHAVTNFSSMLASCQSLQYIPLLDTSSATNMNSMFSTCRQLRSIPLMDTSKVTNFGTMFNACNSLVSVPFLNTAAATATSSMFSGCVLLTTVPLFNTANVTNMLSMFSGCTALQTVPLFNTSNVTTMNGMFSGCSTLQTVPLFDTSKVTTTASMFATCTALMSVPLFNTGAVITMANMFDTCSSLETVPLFNTANVTNMSLMFNSCNSLRFVPLFNTAKVTTMANMFQSCVILTTTPLFNTALVTSMSAMFSSCISLITIPPFITTAVTTMASMFNGCASLQSVPVISGAAISSAANITSMFTGCTSLSSIGLTGVRFSFSVASCKLSPASLDALYTSLATITAQTITVTSNWGTASDTPTIATAKGWTVTGS